MNITHQVEQLQMYPAKASDQFRAQLERARAAREQFSGSDRPAPGIDRSGEFIPVPRPQIVRTLVGE
jgi:hypothetical protein